MSRCLSGARLSNSEYPPMKIHLRADSCNPAHLHFTVFINGQNCGQLCMAPEDAATFHMVLSHGLTLPSDSFVSSGEWAPPSAP